MSELTTNPDSIVTVNAETDLKRNIAARVSLWCFALNGILVVFVGVLAVLVAPMLDVTEKDLFPYLIVVSLLLTALWVIPSLFGILAGHKGANAENRTLTNVTLLRTSLIGCYITLMTPVLIWGNAALWSITTNNY